MADKPGPALCASRVVSSQQDVHTGATRLVMGTQQPKPNSICCPKRHGYSLLVLHGKTTSREMKNRMQDINSVQFAVQMTR